MENGQFDLLVSEIRENRTSITTLIARVAKLEGRYTGMSVVWGGLGGLLSALSVVLLWLATK